VKKEPTTIFLRGTNRNNADLSISVILEYTDKTMTIEGCINHIGVQSLYFGDKHKWTKKEIDDINFGIKQNHIRLNTDTKSEHAMLVEIKPNEIVVDFETGDVDEDWCSFSFPLEQIQYNALIKVLKLTNEKNKI
jgi:hypothetical protein